MFKGKKILIIDDSIVERHLLKKMIEPLNLSVFEADNGEGGISMAIEHQPDIIIMDVVMPGINGFQATKQINNYEALKNIPIIMCTTKDQENDKLWGARQGAKSYMVKPVDKILMVKEIIKLLSNKE